MSAMSFVFNHAGPIGALLAFYTGGCMTPRAYAAVMAWIKSKL